VKFSNTVPLLPPSLVLPVRHVQALWAKTVRWSTKPSDVLLQPTNDLKIFFKSVHADWQSVVLGAYRVSWRFYGLADGGAMLLAVTSVLSRFTLVEAAGFVIWNNQIVGTFSSSGQPYRITRDRKSRCMNPSRRAIYMNPAR
jgi:hypothetical protein